MTATGFLLASGGALANNRPSNGTLSPSQGTLAIARTVSITATYSDPDGAANLGTVYLLMNTSTSGANAIYLSYNSVNNRLYLRNDANTAWLGGIAPGQAGTVENSRVRLRCQNTTVNASGNTLTVTWSIEPLAATAGATLKAYLRCFDRPGVTANWVQRGTFSFGHMPAVEDLTPSSGNLTPGVKQTLQARYSDPDGTSTLTNTYLLINTSLSTARGIYLFYNRVQNRLYVRNDDGTAWLGGVAPGSAGTVSNSSVRVYCAETTVSSGPDGLTVNWRVEPLNGLAGTSCRAYLRAADSSDLVGDWEQKGSLTISRAPKNDSVSPQSAEFQTGVKSTVTAIFKDGDGAQQLKAAYVLINTVRNRAGAGYVYYEPGSRKLYLRNDSGTDWLGGAAVGSSAVIENSQFKLYAAESSATLSGNSLTLKLRLEAKAPMGGKLCSVWLKCIDATDLVADWVAAASFAYVKPPSVASVAIYPQNIVLQPGESRVVRAAIIDDNGRLNNSLATLSWSSSDASKATVTSAGQDGLGEFFLATVTARAAGSVTVSATGGGKSAALSVQVRSLTGFTRVTPSQAELLTGSLQNGESRIYYFQAEPGVGYSIYAWATVGYLRIEVTADSTFSRITETTTFTDGGWDFCATQAAGTYFVRLTGLRPQSEYVFVCADAPSTHTTRTFPILPVWHRLEPGGPPLHLLAGRDQDTYYYFDAQASVAYRVEAEGSSCSITVARDSQFKSVVASAQDSLEHDISPGAAARYFIRIRSTGPVGFQSLRVLQPWAGFSNSPAAQVFPREFSLMPNEQRTGALALKAVWTANGRVVAPPGSCSWKSSSSATTVTPLGLSSDGLSHLAAVRAGAATDLSIIQATSSGTLARSVRTNALNFLSFLSRPIRLNTGVPQTGVLDYEEYALYAVQTIPGAAYQITVSPSFGDCKVYLLADEWDTEFDPFEEGDLGDYEIPQLTRVQCPWMTGTAMIMVEGTGLWGCSYSIRVDLLDLPEQPFVPNTMTRLTVNGDAVWGRVAYWDAGLPWDEEAIFYFDTVRAGRWCTLFGTCYEGEAYVEVADNLAFLNPVAEGFIGEDVEQLSFYAPSAGKRYYVRISGLDYLTRFGLAVSDY